MNQAEILKRLLAEYRLKGGDLGNLGAATTYLNTHKPAGTGRVNEVICGALVRRMGVPVAFASKPTPAPPPAPVEPAPVVVASQTVTFPEVMLQEPVAVYEAPPAPPEPQPLPESGQVPMRNPVVETKKPSLFDRMKFWRKKK